MMMMVTPLCLVPTVAPPYSVQGTGVNEIATSCRHMDARCHHEAHAAFLLGLKGLRFIPNRQRRKEGTFKLIAEFIRNYTLTSFIIMTIIKAG